MFPSSLDDLSTTRATSGTDKLSSPDHLVHHAAEDTLIEAIQTKVGVDNSAVATSLDYIIKSANSINPGHKHNFLSALDGDPAQAVYVDAAGQVGIGTTGPSQKLDVAGVITADNGVGVERYTDTASHAPYVSFRRYRGSEGSESVVQDGDTVGSFIFAAYDGTDASNYPARFGAIMDGTPGTDDTPGALFFSTTPNGSRDVTERMRIDNSGNVGVGTTLPLAKLDIDSDIIRLRTAKTPASAGAAGNAGSICWDASYLYVATATNTWRRVAHATW